MACLYELLFRKYSNNSNLTVKHKENFLNNNSGAHTQYIECVWRRLKEMLREKNYVRRSKLSSYVDEFCFREKFKFFEYRDYLMFIEIVKLL